MGYDLMDVFVKIGADTSALESGINKAGSLAKGVGSGIGGAISKGFQVVGAAVGAATTAVAGFAASSVEVGKSFDSSMSQVAATMGVTVDEIGELRDFAMEMGSSTAFSATQAADALNFMALAGYDAETSMQMLPNVLNLAAAGGMELAQASDMVTDAQTALGLSLSETTELVDMMAKTSSKTNTSVSQLGDAILTIGGTAKNLAGGTTELNQMLGVLADNGIKGAEGGTHLRNAILSLSAPTDNAAAALESLGIATKDMDGNLKSLPEIMGEFQEALDGLGTAERADIISTIFNKTDIAAVNAMIDTSAERYHELENEINGAWMSEKSFIDEMKGAGLENAQSKLEALGLSAEDFDFAAKNSRGSAREFVDTIAELTDTKSMEVLSTMGTNLSDLQRAFDNVSGSAEQMAQTQLDNLSGSITMWSSALEGAQLLISGELAPSLKEFVDFGTEGLQKISEGFKEGGLTGAMDVFKEVLSDGIGMVTEKIPDFVDAGLQLLGALGQGIVDNAPTIANSLLNIGGMLADAALGLAQDMASGLKEFDWGQSAQDIVNWLNEALTGDTASGLLEAGIEIVTSIANGIIEAAPIFLGAAADMLTGLTEGIEEFDFAGAAQSIVDSIVGFLSSDEVGAFAEAAIGMVEALVNGFFEAAPVLVDGALEIIAMLASGLQSGTTGLIDGAINLITGLCTYISENIGSIIEVAMDIIMALVNGIIASLPTLIANLPIILESIVTTITEGLPKLLECGVELIGQLALGILGAIPALIENFPALIQSIVDLFTTFSWWNLGELIIKGIVDGITTLIEIVPNKLSDICNEALNVIINTDWFKSGSEIITKIVNGIASLIAEIPNKIQEIIDAVIDLWNNTDWLSIGTNVVQGIWDGISGGLSWIKERIEGWVGDVFSFLKKLFKIESPSKLMRDEIGLNIAKGVAVGIEAGTPDVLDAMSNMEDLIADPVDASVSVSNFNALGTKEEAINYTEMAYAFIKALEKYGLTVEIDHREFGRIVRKEVMA